MAKRAKQPDADGDDDVYLEVKQEVFGTANQQKNLAPQETRETSTPKTSTPKRYPETEATPSTAKFSKETKAALKIVRKHAPSTPLFKTAVSMITEHVLANKMDQPTSSLRRNTFGFIEEELSRKSTPDVKTNLVIEHVRAEVGCALARNLANVIENKSDLDKALSTVRSAAEERIPGIAKGSTTGDSGRCGKASKRKRAISEVEARKTRPKALKVDESSSAEDDAQNNRAEKDFDLDKFMTYYKKEKAAVYAKRHFVNSERLFDFHVKQLRSTTGYETTKISSPVWSALSAQQKGEWQSLLAALHQGSKEPVGGQGKTLLERQQAKSLSNASAKTADSSSSSSSSDDSGSDEDTASNASTARDSANTSSASQTTYTTDGSARPDFKRVDKRSWSDEENRILLKGLRCGWTNERIQSELPPNSRRTLGAISCAKSAMKKKYLNGLPASQADLPLSVSPASSKRSPQPVSRTAAAPRDTVDGQTKTIAVSVVAPRPVDVPPDAPIGPRTSPKPTFVGWRSRPIGPATQGIEYLLLPIDTPECPVTNARPEDVTEACSQAFGGYSSFQSAHKIEDALWVATFKRSGSLPFPKRRYLETLIEFRGYRFTPRHLSFNPPKTFVADISNEPALRTSVLIDAMKGAFRTEAFLPQLALQIISRPGEQQSTRVVAQFFTNPGLVLFYIPVQVGSSRRWVHVRFQTLDIKLPCSLCRSLHQDGWCNMASPLQYSSS